MLNVLHHNKIIITHTESKKFNPVLEKLCFFLYSCIPAPEKQPEFKLHRTIQMISFIVILILRSDIFYYLAHSYISCILWLVIHDSDAKSTEFQDHLGAEAASVPLINIPGKFCSEGKTGIINTQTHISVQSSSLSLAYNVLR